MPFKIRPLRDKISPGFARGFFGFWKSHGKYLPKTLKFERSFPSQLDRVAHYECEGWGFESLMARQIETVEI